MKLRTSSVSGAPLLYSTFDVSKTIASTLFSVSVKSQITSKLPEEEKGVNDRLNNAQACAFFSVSAVHLLTALTGRSLQRDNLSALNIELDHLGTKSEQTVCESE